MNRLIPLTLVAVLILGGVVLWRAPDAPAGTPPAVEPAKGAALPTPGDGPRQDNPVLPNQFRPEPHPAALAQLGFEETFAAGTLDPGRWVPTSANDFRERLVEVVDRAPGGSVRDYGLRLRADTMGTDDSTVKFLGVRSVTAWPLAERICFSAEIDWNDQANGCYLSAGIVLSPEATTGNPLWSANWLKAEYIGVPPGQNARLHVRVRTNGRERDLFTEGWPANRTGKRIGRMLLALVLSTETLQVWENGQLLYDSKEQVVPFDSGYLYLQVSSHSNYRAREIFFRNIKVQPGQADGLTWP